MCGIVGYLGNKSAFEIIIAGLKRLEYRGYDSSGIALLKENELEVYKKAGKVSNLEDFMQSVTKDHCTGIGHTRWATHGEPTDRNAHPHYSQSKNLALVHNGIIENHQVLKDELIARGHVFNSDTDSEVLIHLIEEIQINEGLKLEKAIQIALQKVVGAYAILIISKNDPEKLIAARKSSPLVIGLKDREFFIASDASPIIEHTDRVIYLKDEEIAVVKSNGDVSIRNIENQIITPFIESLDISIEKLELGGFPHYMLKEIFEQPETLEESIKGRLNSNSKEVTIRSIEENKEKFLNAKRIVIVSCGTSWHAGLLGEYRYREPIINKDDIIIPISQSGETADTIAATQMAKDKGAFIFAICNVAGSTIVRMADAVAFTHAGPEIGVASTKAFTNQALLLSLTAMQLGQYTGHLSNEKFEEIKQDIIELPNIVRNVLQNNVMLKVLGDHYKNALNFLYLGRGYNFPIALEGALKLKEISYIHAEGYPAAEMKHGPIALIDETMPVVVLATNKKGYEKVASNIQEIAARKGQIIAVTFEGDTVLETIANHTIKIPKICDELAPIVSTIPLQLLSYYVALERGCDVDKPRNLAKSVTVE